MTEPDPNEKRFVSLTVEEIRYLRGRAYLDLLDKRKKNDQTMAGRKWLPIAEKAWAKLRAALPEDLEDRRDD